MKPVNLKASILLPLVLVLVLVLVLMLSTFVVSLIIEEDKNTGEDFSRSVQSLAISSSEKS